MHEIRAIADRLAGLTIAQRREVPGVQEGREDVVAAGALLLARIAERAHADDLVVSDGGVRWGLALQMLEC